MATMVTFYTEPLNIDNLMQAVRIEFGDFTGAIYSDTIIRTAIVNGILSLQKRWNSRYQIFNSSIVLDPQPSGVPTGYVAANTVHGIGNIPSGLTDGDVFRNPFIIYDQPSPPVISDIDFYAVVYAAVYALRKAQVSSDANALVSWATEDIRYSNLESGRSQKQLLEQDRQNLDDWFKKNMPKPQKVLLGLHGINTTY